jgi:hypothetical protein
MREGFLKQGNATQIGMRKVDIAKRDRRLSSRRAPDETWTWLNHRMPPTHDVKTFDKGTNIWMRPTEVRDDMRTNLVQCRHIAQPCG